MTAVDDHGEWRAAADVEPTPMTAYDEEPNPLVDMPDARGRVDPWSEHVCPACSEREDEMPRKCRACGWQNYGRETP